MLSEYAAGELRPTEEDAVRAHLAECRECRNAEARIRRTEEVLSELAAVETAPDLTQGLHQRIAATRARTPHWAYAAAACGIALMGLTAGILMRTGAPPSDKPSAPQQLVGASQPVPDVEAPTLECMTEEPQSLPEPLSLAGVTAASERERSPGQGPVAPIRIAEAPDRKVSRDTPGDPADSEHAVPPASETVQPSSEPDRAVTEQMLEGVVLLLGEPQRVPPSGRCYLAVTRSDGSTSVSDNQVIRDAAGAMQAALISNVAMPTNYRLPEQED